MDTAPFFPATGGKKEGVRPPLIITLATGSVTVHTGVPVSTNTILMGPTVSAALTLSQHAAVGEIWAEQSAYQASKSLFTWEPQEDAEIPTT